MIYLVEGSQQIRERIQQGLFAVCADMSEICVSPLTRMECRVLPLRKEDDVVLEKFAVFFNESGVTFLDVNDRVFDLATAFRARKNLKVADALHLATALEGGCTELWTNDKRLAQAAENRIQIVVPIDGIGSGSAS